MTDTLLDPIADDLTDDQEWIAQQLRRIVREDGYPNVDVIEADEALSFAHVYREFENVYEAREAAGLPRTVADYYHEHGGDGPLSEVADEERAKTA